MGNLGNRYFPLVEIAPDPIFLIDAESGNIAEANAAAADLLGYDLSELEGRPVTSIHPSADGYRQLLEYTAKAGTVRTETLEDGTQIRLVTRDGAAVPVELHARTIDIGGAPIIYTITRDISARKEREAALQRQRDRFEAFAEIVSHDIRNPLNVAQARLDLLQDEVDSEHLESLEDSLDRIEDLIEETLALARQGRAAIDPEPVALGELFGACWRTVETVDADFEVADEADLEVVADRTRLRQLLENLIRNAIDHSNGTVTIRLGPLDDGFYLEDDGPGIPAEERGDVFETGYTTAESGTGYGLAIVRETAEDHGWEIDVTDSAGGGARFEIRDVERPTE